MDKGNMKNMVILKDLPSNIVEEAIVILKPNVKFISLNAAETKKDNNKKRENEGKKSKKYIINEAEMVIGNYLSQIEKHKRKTYNLNKKLENKYKIIKIIAIILGIAFVLSLINR